MEHSERHGVLSLDEEERLLLAAARSAFGARTNAEGVALFAEARGVEVRRLSPRKRDVVALIRESLTSEEVAAHLGIAPIDSRVGYAFANGTYGFQDAPRSGRASGSYTGCTIPSQGET